MIHGTGDLIIVGNGMASHALCRWLSEYDVVSRFSQIHVFGDEPRPAYDRVHLSEYFSGKTAHDLELAPSEWYKEQGISLHTGERIDRIDPEQQVIFSSTGQTFPFGKLVLSTGSRPFVPPIPGIEQEGVFVYRTIEDLEAIAEAGQTAKSAVVLGGGLLGLEAAKALRDMGVVPHVVEVAPVLMPRQLDSESGKVLKQRIERLGVQVHLTSRTESIERHGDFLIVQFDSGESLAVDLVVVSAGIRPRDELGRASGLDIGPRGGVVVDDSLTTTHPDIFAIGECVCHRDTLYGLVGPAYQMAKVLASRLAGGKETFDGGDRSARLKLLGVDVMTFGEPIGEAAGARVVTGSAGDDSCRKLIVRNRKIVGALGVGPWPESQRIQAAISASKRASGWQLQRFERSGNMWSGDTVDDVNNWPPSALVCSCMSINRATLTAACQQGCDTIEGLAEQTGASTVCGSCKPLLAQMVGKADEAVAGVAGWRGLLVASVVSLVAVLAFFLIGPIDFSESVNSRRYAVDFFWRDDFWKQVSGYSLLGVTVLSLTLSLRKRWPKLNLGAFGNWRMAHGLLGMITLAGVVAHTGLHMGSNLNFYLMTCFLGINIAGAATGLVTSLESRLTGGLGLAVRQWRPRLTWIHILFFWPLPILIALHVFCIYYY